ncbi:hypothetical protein STEG23_037657, partial [Scotinomys teguina]
PVELLQFKLILQGQFEETRPDDARTATLSSFYMQKSHSKYSPYACIDTDFLKS